MSNLSFTAFKTYHPSILNLFIIFLLIFGSGTIPLFPGIPMFVQVVLLILLGIQMFPLSTMKITNILVIMSVILIIFIFNYLLTIDNHTNFKLYIMYFAYFLNATLFVLHYKNAKKYIFLYDLYIVLKFIMYYSLITFFTQFFVMRQLHVIQGVDEYTVKTFYYILYYMNNNDLILGIFHRNIGIFWEAGILQIYMNVLVFIALFIFNAEKKAKIIAILAGFVILTTFSTTGLLILSTQVFIFSIRNITFKNIKKYLVWLPVLILIAIPLFMYITYNVQQKMSGDNSMSALIRARDLDQGMKTITLYPITGIGVDNDFYKVLQQQGDIVNDPLLGMLKGGSNSNSIISILMYFGLPLGLLILYTFYRQTLIPNFKILLFGIFIISLFSEPLLLTPFFMIFIVSGLVSMLNKKVYNKTDSKIQTTISENT